MTDRPPENETRAGQERLKVKGIRPRPQPDELTKPYWEALRRHELRVLQCDDCGRYGHPPAEECTCGSVRAHWARLSGRATLYSWVIDHRLMVPGFDEPFAIAQVTPIEADDSVRIVTDIVDCPFDDIHIGMPLEVVFHDLDDEVTLAYFRPLEDV